MMLASCASNPVSPGDASATTNDTAPAARPTGILSGYPTDVDQISPLVITTLGPDPIAFTGTDAKIHVVYELQVFNASPRTATLTRVETLAGGPDSAVHASLAGSDVADRTLVVGPPTASEGGPANEIPGGRVALVFLDGTYDAETDVPTPFTHRLTATFASSPDDDRVTTFYPTKATQIGGVVTPSPDPILAIGPPLTGDGWLTTGSCCTMAGHRAFVMPLGGRLNATERYGLEYIRVDLEAERLIDPPTGPASFIGDPTRNESYLAFGQPVLAVADATVTAVVSDFEDRPPGSFAEGLDINDITGNYVVLDLGGGLHAMSNHLGHGSPTVKVGDTVTKGQVIGRVGNSGNTSQPHLHFQLYRGVAALSGDNVPFEIDRFTLTGDVAADGTLNRSASGDRTDQYPLAETVTSYPTP
jgi:hypothetical protein